jgi:predicted deacylase
VYAATPGQTLRKGDLVAEVVNPINGMADVVRAGVSGVFYARIRDRYVTAGCEIGKIAGATPFRTGSLLGD